MDHYGIADHFWCQHLRKVFFIYIFSNAWIGHNKLNEYFDQEMIADVATAQCLWTDQCFICSE